MQTHDEPVPGWTLVLRRQPVHPVEGRPEGGHTDAYELICCDCGDDLDLDYRDISPDLQDDPVRAGLTESPGSGTGVGDGRLAWHTLSADRVLHEDG